MSTSKTSGASLTDEQIEYLEQYCKTVSMEDAEAISLMLKLRRYEDYISPELYSKVEEGLVSSYENVKEHEDEWLDNLSLFHKWRTGGGEYRKIFQEIKDETPGEFERIIRYYISAHCRSCGEIKELIEWIDVNLA